MNNKIANISILCFVLFLVTFLYSFILGDPIARIGVAIISVVAMFASVTILIFLSKKAKQTEKALTVSVQGKLKWWKTGETQNTKLFLAVIEFNFKERRQVNYYSSSGSPCFAEITTFLVAHPFDSEIELKINPKSLKLVKIPDLNLVMSDSNHRFVRKMYQKWKMSLK